MPDRLIVDANIVVASLLRDGATRRILLTQNSFELFSPDFLKQELAKYTPNFPNAWVFRFQSLMRH